MQLENAPRLALLALLLFSLVACGDSGTGPESSMVGEQGGTASLAGGSITLSIPAGALATSVDFTADPTTSVPSTALLLGSAYQLRPAGTAFSRLATLTLTYDPGTVPDGVRQSELRLQQVVGDGWQSTIGSTVDSAQHVVKGQIGEVGTFGVVAVPVATVSVLPSRYTLLRGSTKRLNPSISGSSGDGLPYRRVTWASSDEAVATVDTTGMVTGVAPGSVTITASVEGINSSASVAVYDCSAPSSTVPATQCLALVKIYDALTNSEWRTQTGWVSGTDPCHWHGARCSDDSVHSLSALTLTGAYEGSISPAVGELVDLTTLRITATGKLRSGSIPSTLGSLRKLETLFLIGDNLTGSIPPELGQLSSLKELYLNVNELTGSIPPELGDLSELTVLKLDNNQLSGAVPPELGKLSQLQKLDLISNQLTGSIPRELAGMTSLQYLDLSVNQFSGTIPRELGSLSNLTTLGLWKDQLSGSIPPELGNLSNLQVLVLNENELTGDVPLAVAQLGGRMQLAYNSSACRFVPPGNTGLSLPDTQDYRDADLDGDGKICNLTIGSQ